MNIIKEELIQVTMHPKRILKKIENFGYLLNQNNNINLDFDNIF